MTLRRRAGDRGRAQAVGRSYLNFAEEPVDVRTGYDEHVWWQLTGIR